MKLRYGLVCLTVLSAVSFVSTSASAAKKKSFDLYSWAQAGTANYCYAIVPASKNPRPAAEVKASKDQVCGGHDDLKRIMGQTIPGGSKVMWKVDEAQGFVLPPRNIVNDIHRFAETMPYKLEVAAPK